MQINEKNKSINRIRVLSLCVSFLLAMNFGVQVSLYLLNLHNIDFNLLIAYFLLVLVSFLGYYFILHEYKKQLHKENT
jgi:hypothetical protein